MPEQKTARFHWKRWLFGIVLVAGAAFYWWSVTQCHETALLFHVKLYGLPRSLAIVDPPSKTFEVRVRGPRAAVDRLCNAEQTYPVNLADARPGVQAIAVDSERLPLPADITVLAVSTGDTTIHIEKTLQKTVPVEVNLSGKPAFGYTVTEKRVRPDSVMLKGPESKLAPLEVAPTHPINIKGATEAVRRTVALNLPEGVTVVSEAGPFSAVVGIAEKRIEKTVDAIAVQTRNCTFDHVIHPKTIRLTVSGPVRSFSDPLDIETISAVLDLDSLPPGIYVKPAIIQLPDGIRLVQAEPQVFTVQIIAPTPAPSSGD